MNQGQEEEVTRLLAQVRIGDKDAAGALLPQIYDNLRSLAQHMFRDYPDGHTLQPTALVHEAYLRLVRNQDQSYENRRHFFCVAAKAMRQLLTDYARTRGRDKRGGDRLRVELSDEIPGIQGEGAGIDILALDEALSELRDLNERQAEVVELRFLMALSVDETAELLGVSERTVRLDWTMARAWLERKLGA